MTDESRKRLTLFIGECWHEFPHGAEITLDPWYIYCLHCGCQKSNTKPNRTFTTNDDAHALVLKLEEKGMWRGFWDYAMYTWGENDMTPIAYCLFTYWLISNPARFCEMVNEFLEQKGGGDGEG